MIVETYHGSLVVNGINDGRNIPYTVKTSSITSCPTSVSGLAPRKHSRASPGGNPLKISGGTRNHTSG